jgi:hypothetical protein
LVLVIKYHYGFLGFCIKGEGKGFYEGSLFECVAPKNDEIIDYKTI